MKELVTKKKIVSYESFGNLHHCSAIVSYSFMQNKDDPSALIISLKIGLSNFVKALCDLGINIKLMSLEVFK